MKLLPCPFCGGKAEIERIGTRRFSTLYTCEDCGCSLETGEEFNHGERWNERHSQNGKEGMKMTTCFDVTNLEMPIAVYCEHNGKKEKYWMERGKNGFLKLVCVELTKE